MEPPETPRRDGSYELHGDEIDDPYRWLEDGDDEDVRAWVDAQDDHTEAVLSSYGTREPLRDRMEELARTVEYEPIKPSGGGFFQRVRQPEQDHAVLSHRESLEGERRELLDPNEWSEDGTVSLTWYDPSPDGDLVAYGVDEGGRENYDVHVLDVESGEDVEVLPDRGRAGLMGSAWTDDGFYYVATGDAADGGQLDKELRYHELGTDGEADLVIHGAFEDNVWPRVETTDDADHVVVAFGTWDRTDLYYLDQNAVEDAHEAGGEVDLEPLVEGVDARFEPSLDGDDLYVRTSHEAPNYRVGHLDLAAGDRGVADLATVVPEDDDAILDGVAVTDGRLFVARSRDVVAELAVHDRDGAHRADVDLPGAGTLAALHAHGDADALFCQYEAFDRPQSVCRVDGRDDPTFEIVEGPEVEIEADVAVDQEWFASADGTEVPAFVVRREDIDPDGDNPAVLYGYGGFDISQSPSFPEYAVPFVEDGGVFVVANLRGGGEFGEAWHHAARRETKERTFEDFAAAGEHLLDRGWADPDRLACWGGSNGGLTVGATITRRPELFSAALCQVPLLDMLRFHTSLLGASWTGEYGDPDDPEAYEWLRAYSPYHNVEARSYPDVLFTTALGDTRVDPFHAWKTTARMQELAVETTVLLRTYESTGHGTGKPVSQIVDEACDRWGFLYDRLDVERGD